MAGILSALGILAKRRPILKRFTIECQSNGGTCPPLSGSRYRIVMKRFNFLLTALRRRHTLRRLNGFNHGHPESQRSESGLDRSAFTRR